MLSGSRDFGLMQTPNYSVGGGFGETPGTTWGEGFSSMPLRAESPSPLGGETYDVPIIVERQTTRLYCFDADERTTSPKSKTPVAGWAGTFTGVSTLATIAEGRAPTELEITLMART